jgi:hypothetical protein
MLAGRVYDLTGLPSSSAVNVSLCTRELAITEHYPPESGKERIAETFGGSLVELNAYLTMPLRGRVFNPYILFTHNKQYTLHSFIQWFNAYAENLGGWGLLEQQ